MRIHKIFIIGFLAALIGCGTIKTNTDNNSWKTIQVANIELRYPSELTERPSADDHRIIDNDNDRNDLDNAQEYRIELTPQSKSCIPEHIGIYPTDAIESESGTIITIRGKATFLSKTHGDYDHSFVPTCRSGYAFCSQKDDKQVTICISQKTDDPKLANEIFDSFKWTK